MIGHEMKWEFIRRAKRPTAKGITKSYLFPYIRVFHCSIRQLISLKNQRVFENLFECGEWDVSKEAVMVQENSAGEELIKEEEDPLTLNFMAIYIVARSTPRWGAFLLKCVVAHLPRFCSCRHRHSGFFFSGMPNHRTCVRGRSQTTFQLIFSTPPCI
jgi:hypothetical protein